MGLTLVTGGPGFIGSHVTRALLERGDRVRVTVRARSRLENLEGLDVEHVQCDLLDRRQVRRALVGVDKLFHCAGLTSLRASGDAHFEINVQGTRILFEEALVAGVQRVVHTSSFAAVGPAAGTSRTADERQHFRAGRFGLPYVNAMREGEGEALRLAAQGLPVVIVNPTYVFGRGDVYRSSTEIVRRFLRREIPAYVEGTVNVVAVGDVAAGHLLADERGQVGERYLLGNRNFTLDRLFADLGRISGVEPPAVKLPLPAAIALARALSPLPGTPDVHGIELKSMAQRWPTARRRPSACWAGRPGRTRNASSRPSPGTATASRSSCGARAPASPSRYGRRAQGCGAPRRS